MMFMNERREIDEVFFKQGPILKHNLPVEILGDPLHPRVIQCLSSNLYLIILNMLILMKRRYILLLLVLTFQSMKKRDYARYCACEIEEIDVTIKLANRDTT